MIRIMFVCTGNICRSPMAELVMKQLVRKEGLDWVISSAANTGDEVGNPVYPPAVSYTHLTLPTILRV